ncbi:Sulfite exporter TauE/SafE family protein [Prunus dulcis]|uniref:Sulfite exporter TauE/SafE family protein n=1 Tax=Prunus dulcis TaxID=3755 RepID=A0A4Y1R4K6_PRUDU|nr:Sulfite exporter TauE/SafE family protein [Prunus dulcis]
MRASSEVSDGWSERIKLVESEVAWNAQEILEQQPSSQTLGEEVESNDLIRASKFLSHTGGVAYKHVWPEMRFGWKIAVGTIIGFLGAAFGSVGGVGGGGFFVPMLTLIIGFDQKSSTAISKCMITSGAAATVFYNLRLRHPTLELPLIDYDLALLFQPMLVLGISTSTKSFFRGVETWKKETITKKNLLDASKSLQSKGAASEDITIPGGVGNDTTETKETKRKKIPVTVGITSYEAVKLYKGSRIIESKGEGGANWRVHKLVSYCAFGIVAGILGGLLGLGGGFIMGPVFLEMGIPPQVSSATATFIMTFSSSMSVVEYYLLKRFPIPYALYFAAVATVSAIMGQYLVGKVIKALGRASLIIFILALTIFVSALTLGGVGIANMVKKIEHKESLWFERMCTQKS